MQNLSNIYKLLSNETRLRIVLLLHQEELCVCEFTGILNVSQPKISKSLAKLRDMDLVDDTRREKFVFYKLKEDHTVLRKTLDVILDNIDDYPIFKDDQQRLSSKKAYLCSCSIEALNKLN